MNRSFARRSLAWAILFILGVAVVWLAQQAAVRAAPPRIGGPAPDLSLESTDAQKISLNSFRGKPVVMVFVASWCQVCRDEMPIMAETARAHQEHGVAFLGVDVYEDFEVAQQFHHEFYLPFPLLVDAFGEVTTRYRVNGTPTTFFIDRDGIIRDVVVGGPLERVYLDRQIAPLLAERR